MRETEISVYCMKWKVERNLSVYRIADRSVYICIDIDIERERERERENR